MDRSYESKVETKTLAIGITGDLSSLWGAIERFQHRGPQWNGLLTLKEQCARRIVLLKNEQLKCFITAYLPPTLFKYVRKDIFNLRRSEFTSNYAKPLDTCQYCAMEANAEWGIPYQCANIHAGIYKLNKCFVKRINKRNKTKKNQYKRFDLTYKMANNEDFDFDDEEEPISYFLYLFPCEYDNSIEIYDTDDISYQSHRFINGHVSVQEKLLFVDVMRLFGGFHTDKEQPQLILSERCDIDN